MFEVLMGNGAIAGYIAGQTDATYSRGHWCFKALFHAASPVQNYAVFNIYHSVQVVH